MTKIREGTNPTETLRKNPPKTKEEMKAWIEYTKTVLLEYLRFCGRKAHEQPVADKIKKMSGEIDREWHDNWAPQNDVQTGEIYDEGVRGAMFDAMEPLVKACVQYQRRHQTTERHKRYLEAQSYWEDFLYYQNPWNRRVEKKPSTESPFNEDPPNEDPPKNDVHEWALFLTDLFTEYKIGARCDHVEPLGHEQLHQYPASVRKKSSCRSRRKHIRKQFPKSALRFDHDQIEHRRDQVDAGHHPGRQDPSNFYSAAVARGWRDHCDKQHPTSWESQEWTMVTKPRHSFPSVRRDDRPRYQTKEVESLVRTFVWKLKSKGRLVESGSGDAKTFAGHYLNRTRYERHFVLDVKGQRIEEPQTPKSTKIYGSTNNPALEALNRLSGPGRKDRARLRVTNGTAKDWRRSSTTARDTRDPEFSDDESNEHPSSEDESDPGDKDSEGDSDDDHDLFTLSYRGLRIPADESDSGSDDGGVAPRRPLSDGGSDENDDDSPDDKKRRRDKRQNVQLAPSSVKEPSASTNDTRVSKHKPNAKSIGETFQAVPGSDEWDLATYTHTFPDGTTFTQRTLVPAFKETVESATGGDPPRKVYPGTSVIPVGTQKGTPWKNNLTYLPREENKFEAVNGRWDKGKAHWVPTVIVRSFRLDNNAYYNCSINPHFDAVMKGDETSNQALQDQYIAKYNKVLRQFLRRSDCDAQAKIEAQCGPWTVEELNLARAFVNDIIHRDGLIQWSADWTIHSKALHEKINSHRLARGRNDQEKKARTRDSTSSKFKRYFADLFDRARKLEAEVSGGHTVSIDRLKPKEAMSSSATDARKGKASGKQSKITSGSGRAPPALAVSTERTSTKRTRYATSVRGEIKGDSMEAHEVSDDEERRTTRTPPLKRARTGKR